MSRLRIAEIFTSLQGEGLWAGTPSAFVRVSGCNLRCVWCDTPYASWRPEGPVRDVADVADDVLATGVTHVVLTGGEPMLFEGVVDLAGRLKEAGRTITIETAGTVFQELQCDLMSISPKLSNSSPPGPERARHELVRADLAPLARLVERYNFQLKFVVSAPSDLEEIEALLAHLPASARERVLLMPEGTDSETLWRRARELVPVCMERGFRLCPRLHVDLFGHTRGT